MSAKYYTKGKAAPAAARSPASILELDQTRAADCRGSRARVVNWSDSTQKMPCIRPKSAKKCHCNLKCPKSAIPNSCILLHLKKIFPKFDAKKWIFKKVAWKLHDTLLMQYFIWFSCTSTKFRATFCTQALFFVTTWLLKRRKKMSFYYYCIYLYNFLGHQKCQKMPKRVWHFCFFQKMPWGLIKGQNCVFWH